MMIRVLHVLARMPIGGIGSFLINTEKHINKKMFSFSYLIIENVDKSDFLDSIRRLGSEAYIVNETLALSNFFRIYSKVDAFFNNYAQHVDVVHLHSANIGSIIFPIAKKHGISCRVLHAHSTKLSDSKFKSVRNYIIQKPAMKYVTNRIACSRKAGIFYFDKDNFDIIYNGIDTTKFYYDKSIKNQYNKNTLIVGHVGNFLPVKNHQFIINVFKKVAKCLPTAELWLAGNGPLLNDIKRQVCNLNLEKQVKFLGRVNDMQSFYNRIDVFLLPSLFEGFPVALMEAQATGVAVIASKHITNEVNFFNDVVFLNVTNNDIEDWADKILTANINDRLLKSTRFLQSEFDINVTTRKLEQLYKQYLSTN